MDRILVVIGTPLQLLNAIEYLAEHGNKRCEVDLVDISFSKENRPIIDEILKSNSKFFQTVFRLPFVSSKSKRAVTNGFRLLANRISYFLMRELKRQKYQTIIIGHYALPIFRYFLRKNSCLIVVDDGMFTLNCPEKREVELREGTPFRIEGGFHHRFNQILWRNQTIPDRVTWFTRYELKFPENDLVLMNDLAYLRSLMKSKSHSSTLVFIGMNLVECGILSSENYLGLVETIAEENKHLRFIYVAKYSESREMLTKIAKMLSNFNAEIVRPESNLEVYLCNSEFRPAIVASFYTSALTNAMDILGNTADYICIDVSQKLLNTTRFNIIKQCYRTIEKHPVFQQCGRVCIASVET